MDLDDVERICWWGAGISWVIFLIVLVGELFALWGETVPLGLLVAYALGLGAVFAIGYMRARGHPRTVEAVGTDEGQR